MIKNSYNFLFFFLIIFLSNLGNTPPSSDGEQNLVYRLSKCEIDDAHKDKTHKIYPPSFEVIKKTTTIKI